MEQIKQEILAIDVIDVAIIRVSPIGWPNIDQRKRVSPVFKPRLTLHDHGTLRPECMASAKLRVEAIVGNVAALALRPRVTFLRLLPPLFHFVPRLLFFLLLLLLRRLGFVLTRSLHLILPGRRLGFILLFGFLLTLWFFLTFWFFLPRFIFLLLFVLGIQGR